MATIAVPATAVQEEAIGPVDGFNRDFQTSKAFEDGMNVNVNGQELTAGEHWSRTGPDGFRLEFAPHVNRNEGSRVFCIYETYD